MERYLRDSKSLIFDRSDPYRVSDYINQHVGSHGIRLPNAHTFEASLSHQKFGRLDLCRVSYGGKVRVVSPGLEQFYHAQLILRGQCLYKDSLSENLFTPGEILLINPVDSIDLTYSDDCEKFILKLPRDLLDTVCLEHRWNLPRDGIRFTLNRYHFSDLSCLINFLALLCQEAESGGIPVQMHDHYNRIVASKFLTLLKHNVSRDEGSMQSVSFERIAQYIEDNIKRDITIEDLVQQARISQRSLYSLFERHAKTSPKNYIKQKKLDHIHKRLTEPGCTARSITALALDYGFLHLGRFSESYKRAFGVLPSDTLRQRH